MNTASTLAPLLFNLYGSCTRTECWTQALDLLCDELGAKAAAVYCVSFDDQRAVPYWMSYNSRFDSDSYQAAIADDHNPRLEARRLRQRSGTDGLGSDDTLFSPSEYSARAQLQRRFADIGLGRFIGAIAPLDTDRYFTVALFREPEDPHEYSEAQRQMLSALLPHFVQATQLSETMTQGRFAATLVDGHLERWPCALVLCDTQGQVQWLNRQAKTLLYRSAGLQVRNGELRAGLPGTQKRLAKACQEALQRDSATYLALETLQGRLQLALQPVTPAHESSASYLLISIATEDQTGLVPPDALRALFDLTEAEAQLASALVAGMTVEQYAQKRGVTVGTARYQLNQVLVKSGARRQADLVRRVLNSAAAHLAVLGQHMEPDA
ncbi:helix-turn-helix transcriptional regulator [Kerstersia similis]|uniref:helix-turn-helix transcriptional regulator n=1 Tax=Kerstersia similis TaxID=206505 RepID=UPI0039EEDE66